MALHRVFLSLGSNLGNREVQLDSAIEQLDQADITVKRRSSVYETAPRDVLDQPFFLNMVLECETRLFPAQLLKKLLKIERALGRQRGPTEIRRGPRLIDIDILLFDSAVIDTTDLTIPHPRMVERRFVLEPLLELEPKLKDPRSRRLLSDFLRGLSDQGVRRLKM